MCDKTHRQADIELYESTGWIAKDVETGIEAKGDSIKKALANMHDAVKDYYNEEAKENGNE